MQLQLPCGGLERTSGSRQQYITTVDSGRLGSARLGSARLGSARQPQASDDIVAWLEEWLRHERQTMDERHKSMMYQIGSFMRSDRPGAAGGATQEGITEKSAVELVNLMQPISKQVQELTADLRTTHSELGTLRATIDASNQRRELQLHHEQSRGATSNSSKIHEWNVPSPPAMDSNAPKHSTGGDSSAATKTKNNTTNGDRLSMKMGGYNSGALKAFNSERRDIDRSTLTLLQRVISYVETDHFEMFFGALILLSAVALGMEIQYEGFQAGHDIGYVGYPDPNWQVWPWAEDAFIWLERAFTIFFTMELMLRLLALQHKCLWDRWMYLDTFVVFFSLLALFRNSPIKMNVTVLRIIRIGRMLRILRIVRFIRFFDSLYLMIRSVQSSWSALLWSFALLMMVQMLSGLILCQTMINWIDNNRSAPGVDKLFEYFGTFTRTTLTMWEIMMANWIAPARIVVKTCGEGWTLFFLAYRCMLGFALLAVISAVFIHETMKVADTDDEVAVFIAQRDSAIYTAKLKDAFMELDDSGDGYVNWKEISQIMEDDIMKHWLKSMQIDVTQVHNLFHVLDDGDGKISFQEFMSGIQKVKGNAKSIDVVMLKKMVTNLDKKLDRLRYV